MRIRNLVGLLFLLPMGLGAADKIQLNVKTGLWETTATTINGRQADTNTDRECLTREKLEKGLDFGIPKSVSLECTQTIVTSTSSKAEIRITCEANGMKVSGTINFEALNPESVRGSTHMTTTRGGRATNMDMNFTSKWLGEACGGVE